MNGRMNRIELDGSGNVKTSLLESEAQSARPGKKVDRQRPLVLWMSRSNIQQALMHR